MIRPTELFVYGTLRHDQPEHARYCRGVRGWQAAWLHAELWILPAGYRIVRVPAASVLFVAGADPGRDEERRAGLTPDAIAAAAAAGAAGTNGARVEGELLRFRDAAEAWPPLDAWEEFSPGRVRRGYARAVVPAVVPKNSVRTTVAAWAYVAMDIPPGATRVSP